MSSNFNLFEVVETLGALIRYLVSKAIQTQDPMTAAYDHFFFFFPNHQYDDKNPVLSKPSSKPDL